MQNFLWQKLQRIEKNENECYIIEIETYNMNDLLKMIYMIENENYFIRIETYSLNELLLNESIKSERNIFVLNLD